MRACGILFLFFQLSIHEMYDPIIFNSGDTCVRGGRNVQKVEDEYLYSCVAFYMQKWTRRSTCLVIPLIIKWRGTSLVLLGRKLYRKKSKKIYHAGWYSDARGDDKLMFFFFTRLRFYCGFVVERNSACFSKREKKTVEEAFAEFILKDFGI